MLGVTERRAVRMSRDGRRRSRMRKIGRGQMVGDVVDERCKCALIMMIMLCEVVSSKDCLHGVSV